MTKLIIIKNWFKRWYILVCVQVTLIYIQLGKYVLEIYNTKVNGKFQLTLNIGMKFIYIYITNVKIT